MLTERKTKNKKNIIKPGGVNSRIIKKVEKGKLSKRIGHKV